MKIEESFYLQDDTELIRLFDLSAVTFNEGDIFHYSLRGISPRKEADFKNIFKPDFVDSIMSKFDAQKELEGDYQIVKTSKFIEENPNTPEGEYASEYRLTVEHRCVKID